MLQGRSSRSKAASRRLLLLGKPVCLKAFAGLLGLGTSRFRKLRKSALAGTSCPVDGRFVAQKFRRGDGAASYKLLERRQHVVDFLQQLYHESAEPMPSLSHKAGPGDGFMKFRRQRGRRPRHFWHREQRKRDAAQNQRTEMRYLPPGTFADYRGMLRANMVADGLKPVSLKVFKTATLQNHET